MLRLAEALDVTSETTPTPTDAADDPAAAKETATVDAAEQVQNWHDWPVDPHFFKDNHRLYRLKTAQLCVMETNMLNETQAN